MTASAVWEKVFCVASSSYLPLLSKAEKKYTTLGHAQIMNRTQSCHEESKLSNVFNKWFWKWVVYFQNIWIMINIMRVKSMPKSISCIYQILQRFCIQKFNLLTVGPKWSGFNGFNTTKDHHSLASVSNLFISDDLVIYVGHLNRTVCLHSTAYGPFCKGNHFKWKTLLVDVQV